MAPENQLIDFEKGSVEESLERSFLKSLKELSLSQNHYLT